MRNHRRQADAPVARALRPRQPGYPPILAEINDPPRVLYVKGALPAATAIAIVGSRACTAYGARTAYRLAAELASAGFPVVSGLARGIDAAAHRGALDADGETIAVLPCGIERIYPERHFGLASHIVRSGALVSELEGAAGVHGGSFAQRNRIIAGLAAATVVVEAAKRSGAKITASYALQYNRELMAVPGPVGSATSAGANELIAEGAAPCTGIESLVAQLPAVYRQEARARADALGGTAAVDELAAKPRAVFEATPESGAFGVEQLIAATSLPIGELLAILTDMEVRGLIRSIGGQRYERV